MELNGTRIGRIEYQETDLLNLPSGLIGMPALKRFIILDFAEDIPFKWLQSVEEPGLGFIIAEPQIFRADFGLVLDEEEIQDLACGTTDDLAVFVLCAFDSATKTVSGNLRGPILANIASRLAQQIVVEDSEYGTNEMLNHFVWEPKKKKEKEQVAESHG